MPPLKPQGSCAPPSLASAGRARVGRPQRASGL